MQKTGTREIFENHKINNKQITFKNSAVALVNKSFHKGTLRREIVSSSTILYILPFAYSYYISCPVYDRDIYSNDHVSFIGG